jgi:hypothetical protein
MPVHPQDEWVGDETAELSDLAGRAGYQLNLQAMRKNRFISICVACLIIEQR